jgi:uncharacterized protein (TIGR03435 family)
MKVLPGILALASCLCSAPDTSSHPEFQVASVKPAQPGPQGVWTNGSPDGIRMLNMSLRTLVSFAYDTKEYEVQATGWMESDKYDIVAKVSADEAKMAWKKKFALMRQMTQTLLADRFKLVVRREKKDWPVYALVPVKTGTKIHETGPYANENVNAQMGRGHLSAKDMPMSQLIEILSERFDRPVLDFSGVKGVFDIKLDWAPETQDPTALDPKPPLPLALEEQLGLKLEPRKAPIDILVIDHAEKVTGN